MAKPIISVQQQARRNNRYRQEVEDERDAGAAYLRNLSTNHTVRMSWGHNEAMKADGVFEMEIGGHKAMIEANELRRFLRWC